MNSNLVEKSAEVPELLEKRLFAGLLLLILLAPTQLSLELKGIHLSAADPLAGALFLGTTALLLLRRRGWGAPPPFLAFLLTGLTALSILAATEAGPGIRETLQTGMYLLLIYFLGRNLLRTAESRRRAAYAMLLADLVVIATGLYQYTESSLPPMEVRALFGNRNILSGFLAFQLPFLLGMFLGEHRLWLKGLLLATLTAGWILILAGGAWLAAGIGCLLVAALHSRATLLLLLALLLPVLFFILPHLPRNPLAELTASVALYDEEGAVTPRYNQWLAAAAMLGENPVTGVGAGNFQLHIGEYYGYIPPPAERMEDDINNLYLVLASTCGLPALLCLVGLLFDFFADALRGGFCRRDLTKEERRDRALAMGIAGSVVAFTLASLFTHLLVRGPAIPFLLLAGMAGALAEAHKLTNAREGDANRNDGHS